MNNAEISCVLLFAVVILSNAFWAYFCIKMNKDWYEEMSRMNKEWSEFFDKVIESKYPQED